jgi:hypothetical protein
VKTTPAVSTAAVNVNIRDYGRLSFATMLKINAPLDALTVAIKHAKTDPIASLLVS